MTDAQMCGCGHLEAWHAYVGVCRGWNEILGSKRLNPCRCKRFGQMPGSSSIRFVNDPGPQRPPRVKGVRIVRRTEFRVQCDICGPEHQETDHTAFSKHDSWDMLRMHLKSEMHQRNSARPRPRA